MNSFPLGKKAKRNADVAEPLSERGKEKEICKNVGTMILNLRGHLRSLDHIDNWSLFTVYYFSPGLDFKWLSSNESFSLLCYGIALNLLSLIRVTLAWSVSNHTKCTLLFIFCFTKKYCMLPHCCLLPCRCCISIAVSLVLHSSRIHHDPLHSSADSRRVQVLLLFSWPAELQPWVQSSGSEL